MRPARLSAPLVALEVTAMKKFALLVPTFIVAAFACDVPLQDDYELQSPSSIPEGVAYDEVTHTFFATAINGGQITRVTPFGDEVVFHTDSDPNRSFGGAHVDDARRRLWVCVVDVKSGPFPVSEVWGFDIDKKKATIKVPLPQPSFCNDLVTDAQGVVYATDSALPNIYRVDPATATFSVFLSSPEFLAQPQGTVGLNGIDFSPDGERLLVAQSFPAALYSVPVDDPTAYVHVQTGGDPFPGQGPQFPAPDGVEFLGDQLYVVYDGGVQQLSFDDDDYTSATVASTTAVPSGLTSLTIAEGELFAIDSELFRVLYMGQPPELPFRILRVDTDLFGGAQ
jgi:sugar lactone lactonase YvrE